LSLLLGKKTQENEENVNMRNKRARKRQTECRGSNTMDMLFCPLGFKEKLIIFSWNVHFKHM
jgi:hypothetical protein